MQFVSGIIASIIDNIQISIKNVYFRFEDDLQGQEIPFAIGLKLKEFSVSNNSDENDGDTDLNIKRIARKSSGKNPKFLTYKKATVNGLSIFCDYENINLRENGGIDLELLN